EREIAESGKALSPVRVDLLLPHKRIRCAVTAFDYDNSTKESYEANTEPDIDSNVQADINVYTTAAEATASKEADVEVEVGIGSDGEDDAEEEVESRNRGTIEIGVGRVSDIKSDKREQKHGMLDASEQRTSILARIGVLKRDNMRLRGMLYVEREQVNSLRCHRSYTQEELRQMRVSRCYDRAEFRRLL
ncbi:hypothetical protein Tco_1234166, partial [Tanacetum coccineum]